MCYCSFPRSPSGSCEISDPFNYTHLKIKPKVRRDQICSDDIKLDSDEKFHFDESRRVAYLACKMILQVNLIMIFIMSGAVKEPLSSSSHQQTGAGSLPSDFSQFATWLSGLSELCFCARSQCSSFITHWSDFELSALWSMISPDHWWWMKRD